MQHPKYRPDIDGLRGFAVLAVVGFHAFPGRVPGGYAGVDVFFVISGYLISTIIFQNLVSDRFSFKTFYARRIKRIFPALTLVLIACYVTGWFTLAASPYQQLGEQTAAGAGFLSNFALYHEAGYFDVSSAAKPLLHLWSLGIEEQFYLLWPLLLYVAWRFRGGLLRLVAVLTAASFLLNVFFVQKHPSADFYFPVTRLWELSLGSILAYCTLYRSDAVGLTLQRFNARITLPVQREVRAVSGFILLALAVSLLNAASVFPGWWALLPTLGTALLISAGPASFVNQRILSHRLLVGVGLISFPLYLWHWPLLSFAWIVEFGRVSVATRGVLVLVAIVLAWLTTRFVERPIRSGSNRPQTTFRLCALMVVIACAGGAAWALKGMPERAVTRSPKLAFLAHYDDLHVHGLAAAYRSECDFYDWNTKQLKATIAPACTDVPVDRSVFLWGDSHAQALSLGLRELYEGHAQVAQVASSGCSPSLDRVQLATPANDCDPSNRYALKEIARLRPSIVFLAQAHGHPATDWNRIAKRLHDLGVGRVVLVGPVPQWLPSLPYVFVRDFWKQNPSRVKVGLDPQILAEDRTMRLRFADSSNLTYISLIQSLCNDAGCLIHVPSDPELIAVDYGHLTPEGSVYVVKTIVGKALLDGEPSGPATPARR